VKDEKKQRRPFVLLSMDLIAFVDDVAEILMAKRNNTFQKSNTKIHKSITITITITDNRCKSLWPPWRSAYFPVFLIN
jgi:hypothetical protein